MRRNSFIEKISKDNKTRSFRVPDLGSPIKKTGDSNFFELNPKRIENELKGYINIFEEHDRNISNQNFDSYIESDARGSFDASFYNEMESIEHRSERLESQESVVIRRITESNQVNPSSTNFIQK